MGRKESKCLTNMCEKGQRRKEKRRKQRPKKEETLSGLSVKRWGLEAGPVGMSLAERMGKMKDLKLLTKAEIGRVCSTSTKWRLERKKKKRRKRRGSRSRRISKLC